SVEEEGGSKLSVEEVNSALLPRYMDLTECGSGTCQNVCSRLTAFRLEQIEHLLSRYLNKIDCVLTAEAAVVAEGRISCSSSHRSHVTNNPGQSPSANPPTAEMG